MKPRLFDSGKKMRMINQLLHKRRKLELKKLRIQQQQQQSPINITINNTGFETNQRIKEIYKRLELIAPQEKVKPKPPPPPAPPVKRPTEMKIYNPTTNRFILQEGIQGTELEKQWGRGEFKDKDGKVLKLKDDKFLMDKNTDKKELKIFGKALKQKYFI